MWTQLWLPFPSGLPIIRSIDPPTYWRRYNNYLKSSFWKHIRKQTLERAEYLCEAKYPGCTQIGTEVHHRSYLRWNGSGDRPGVDTMAICRSCHQWAHAHPMMLPDPPDNDNLPPPYRAQEIV